MLGRSELMYKLYKNTRVGLELATSAMSSPSGLRILYSIVFHLNYNSNVSLQLFCN